MEMKIFRGHAVFRLFKLRVQTTGFNRYLCERKAEKTRKQIIIKTIADTF